MTASSAAPPTGRRRRRPLGAGLALWIGILVLVSASVCWTGDAIAEPTSGEKASARAWMATGRLLRSQGNLEGALQSFSAAESIMHVPTTGIEVARTLEAMGRLVEAEATLRRVLATPVSPNDPPPFQEALSAANVLFAELGQRIPVVTFVIPTAFSRTPPRILVDGTLVQPGDLGTPLKLDPGVHKITARLGQFDASQSVELRERARQPIVVRPPSTASRNADGADRNTFPWRTVGYASFGVSAAGLLVGTIAGTLALSTKHAAEQNCNSSGCTAAAWDSIDRSRNYATASAIGFATFGTTLGIGFMSLALAPARELGTASSFRLRPSVGLGSAQIEGTF